MSLWLCPACKSVNVGDGLCAICQKGMFPHPMLENGDARPCFVEQLEREGFTGSISTVAIPYAGDFPLEPSRPTNGG